MADTIESWVHNFLLSQSRNWEMVWTEMQVPTSTLLRLVFGCTYKTRMNLKTQSVPRSKHSVWVTKISQLMLYREKIAVCSEIHTKHINTAVCVCVWERERRFLFKPEWYIKTQSVPRSKHSVCYKNQSVNVVWGNNGCLFWDPHKTHKCSERERERERERRFLFKPEWYIKTQSVPRSEHSPSRLQKPVS